MGGPARGPSILNRAGTGHYSCSCRQLYLWSTVNRKGTLSARLDADTSAFEFSHKSGINLPELWSWVPVALLWKAEYERVNPCNADVWKREYHNVGSGVQQIGGLGFNGGTLILVPLCRAIPLPATVLKPLLQDAGYSGERHNSGHHARWSD